MSLSTMLDGFFSAFAPKILDPKMETHFFTFIFDDPVLFPLYAEVEVWNHDSSQVLWTMDTAIGMVVNYLPIEQVARDALAEGIGHNRFHRHFSSQEDFDEYKRKTGLRLDKWCTIRRNEAGKWTKYEEPRQ